LVNGGFVLKIINKLVNNRDVFLDILLKELCQRGISYVLVDNELHVGNVIIRFYTFQDFLLFQIYDVISALNLNFGDDSLPLTISDDFFYKKEEIHNPCISKEKKPYTKNTLKNEYYLKRKMVRRIERRR